MTSWKDKLAVTAQRNRQEIVKAKLGRREMMRLGLLTAGGTLVAKAGLSSRAFADGSLNIPGVDGVSPPVTPWQVEMPRLWLQQPVDYHKMEFGPPTGKTPVDGATRQVDHFRTKRLQACPSASLSDCDRVCPRRSHRRAGHGCPQNRPLQGHLPATCLTALLCELHTAHHALA